MVAYVFPGQGSQQKGMGGELFDEFKELTAKADEILGYSIKELCMEDPQGNLGQTQYTQPALYIVNALMYYKKIKETEIKPDFVAGHSLAEYNALLAAEVFDFETGLRIVKKRGELMSKASGGGMAAVIGMSEEKIKEVLKENDLNSIDIANYNTPSQIAISGPKDDIVRAQPFFEAAGVRSYIVLKVSGAFHSRYMQPSKEGFEEFINQFKFAPPQISVISNLRARPYKKSEIKKNMAEQITNSVKWTESIRYIMGKGVVEITQVGPGTAVAGLVRSIQREAEPLVVDEAEEVEEDVSDETEASADAREEVACAVDESIEVDEEKSDNTDEAVSSGINAVTLGSEDFKREYNIKYAYLTGGMYRGIASKELVVKIGKAGMMGFLGTGGVELSQVESDIKFIQKKLNKKQAYGVNVVHNPNEPKTEEELIDIILANNVKVIEAAAFLTVTPALVKYLSKGLSRDKDGKVVASNKIIAKISRPEVAEAFLSPAPERIVSKLLSENKISSEEVSLLKEIPLANDICVEADSGGHTDGRSPYSLMPALIKLRSDMMEKYKYSKKICVGAAGGIGTPEAAAAAFILGADFILTGSINQCTVEAGTSDSVKDLLQQMNVQDTDYAPAGDMFELGAKVQVLKKGLFFPARANKLYELYRQYNSLDEIDQKTKTQIQEKYFKRSFEKVYEDIKSYYPSHELEKAEQSPKHKMALIFRWYFGYSTRLALSGDEESRVDYQVHCGPALGAFNQWVKGTSLEDWRKRHVDEIAMKLMSETADLLNQRFAAIHKG